MLIELRAVDKVYGRGDATIRALDGIDLRIEDGEFVVILGASGSGKSTCMNILGCLDTPSAGHYQFRNIDVAALGRDQLALLRRHYIGFVFQSFNLLAGISVLENVELPLIYRGYGRARRRALALAALASVGLADRARHTPSQLSGDQQQRVAIARALVGKPALLLADEPTGNLDSKRAHEIMWLLQQLHRERAMTIVMVTHERALIREMVDRVVAVRDGRVVDDGRPSEVLRRW